MKYKVLILCLSTFLISCGIQMNRSINDPILRISQFIDSQTKDSIIPGIQYVAVDLNGTIIDYASGYSDIKNSTILKSNTTLMMYSMTKTFTAIAILQLVESGKIKLDDPVIKYLPNIPYGNEITIRQLITHTSGIPNPIPLKWVHLADKHFEYNESRELSNLLGEYDELLFNPGKKYAYSNIGYWLLGKIIEKTTHLTSPDYMSQYIFNKLGFERNELSFTINNSTNHSKGYLAKYSFFNLIKGFLIDDELIGEYEKNWLHIRNHYLNGPPFGGLIGSAKDIAVFLQDQLRPQSGLIGEEMKTLLYTQQKDNAGDPIEMSLGWHIGNLKDIRYFYKEGGGGGYHSEMRIYPSQGIGSVIIVNRTNFNSKKYLNTIDDVLISK